MLVWPLVPASTRYEDVLAADAFQQLFSGTVAHPLVFGDYSPATRYLVDRRSEELGLSESRLPHWTPKEKEQLAGELSPTRSHAHKILEHEKCVQISSRNKTVWQFSQIRALRYSILSLSQVQTFIVLGSLKAVRERFKKSLNLLNLLKISQKIRTSLKFFRDPLRPVESHVLQIFKGARGFMSRFGGIISGAHIFVVMLTETALNCRTCLHSTAGKMDSKTHYSLIKVVIIMSF